MKYSHIVFDLDGTIVESLPGITAGLNAALAELGKAQLEASDVRHMIGRGAKELCSLALGYKEGDLAPEQEIESLLDAFRREYRETWKAEGTRIFPGVLPMMMKLSAAGARIAVLSNKPHEATSAIVSTLFCGMPISPVIGYEKGRFPRKPDPAALHFIAQHWGVKTEELMLVGDSIHDAHTAENAGCHLALVPWGYAHLQDLFKIREEHNVPILGTVEGLTHYLVTGYTRIESVSSCAKKGA